MPVRLNARHESVSCEVARTPRFLLRCTHYGGKLSSQRLNLRTAVYSPSVVHSLGNRLWTMGWTRYNPCYLHHRWLLTWPLVGNAALCSGHVDFRMWIEMDSCAWRAWGISTMRDRHRRNLHIQPNICRKTMLSTSTPTTTNKRCPSSYSEKNFTSCSKHLRFVNIRHFRLLGWSMYLQLFQNPYKSSLLTVSQGTLNRIHS